MLLRRKVILAALGCFLVACDEPEPNVRLGSLPDSGSVQARQLELRTDELAPGAQRIEVDLLLTGDLTQEGATMAVRQMLEALREQYPQATVLRAIGLALEFDNARGQQVPVIPVLIADHLPIVGDTLEPVIEGVLFRTNVRFLKALPAAQ